MSRYLIKDAATTVLIGPLFDWSDSKTLLYDALGGNSNFDPADIVVTLFKGTTPTVLSLSKSGGNNDINLVDGGMATLELTALNTDTAGDFTIAITNATSGQEVVFPCSFDFTVITQYSDVSVEINGEPYSPVSFIVSANPFLQQFGEVVSYYPAGGVMRQILAIIDRNPINRMESGRTTPITIVVANNSSSGIASDEIDTGGDKIALQVRLGQDLQQRSITGINWQDDEMMELEVR